MRGAAIIGLLVTLGGGSAARADAHDEMAAAAAAQIDALPAPAVLPVAPRAQVRTASAPGPTRKPADLASHAVAAAAQQGNGNGLALGLARKAKEAAAAAAGQDQAAAAKQRAAKHPHPTH